MTPLGVRKLHTAPVYTPAMASRKLGGGRILGSGKSLAPPAPALQRPTNLLTPSDSTASFNSDISSISPLPSSPLPENIHDLSSRVSLQNENSGPSVTAASAKLVCPICNEEMVRTSKSFSCARTDFVR